MSVVGKMVGTAVVAVMCALHGDAGFAQINTHPAAGDLPDSLPVRADLIVVEAPVVRSGENAQEFPQGSRLIRLHVDAAGHPEPVPLAATKEFFAAADPAVSSDGREILFAGEHDRNGLWQIFETKLADGSVRQVTRCANDCIRPVYLPEGFVVYTAMESSGSSRNSQVEISRVDGSDAHPITLGPGRFAAETALRSGRLLLSANSPLVSANAPRPSRALYLIDPDGSGLGLFRQDETSRVAPGSAQELGDGSILFAEQGTGRPKWTRPGALRATPIAGVPTGYAYVRGLADGTVVASRRTVSGQSDLYRMSFGKSERPQLLYRGSQGSIVQAVEIAPHSPVEGYRSILHPERVSGRLVCLNAYASKDVASGHLAGKIARVRVLAKVQTGEKILGEAPVEKDGSFYATVPANLPIRLMLLGSKGEMLRQQRSWMWVRSGEDRGCFGCHESQAQAPQNHSPMTLQRMDTPTPLMGDSTTPTIARTVRP